MTELEEYERKKQADAVIAGFEYQFYYFLLKLLEMNSGDEVGFEVKDDVHITFLDGTQELVQLKHTIQKTVNDKNVNLANKDLDIWKTIKSWIEIIKLNDNSENFIKRTTFKLVTNKSFSKRNKFISDLSDFKNDNSSYVDLIDNISNLLKESDNEDKKKTVDEAINCFIAWTTSNEKEAQLFLSNIEVEHDFENIFLKIRKQLMESWNISEKSCEDTFSRLDSAIRKDNYEKICNREKIVIDTKLFHRKYRRCFVYGNNEVPLRPSSHHKIPKKEDWKNQVFIRQIMDVNPYLEDAKIQDYTSEKIETLNVKWVWMNELYIYLPEDVKRFDEEWIKKWENIFDRYNAKYKRILKNNSKSDEEKLELLSEIALDFFHEFREKANYELNGICLKETKYCNGQVYLLSDQPVIGWGHDWEELYKTKDK
ncbi:MAG: hypothetical protein ACI81T_002824 [Bacteroidia bacterium]|jgi:hypothetical protein